MITVTLNGKPHGLAAPCTLAELLVDLGQVADAAATAINGEFVARAARAQRTLQDCDDVFAFQAITGG